MRKGCVAGFAPAWAAALVLAAAVASGPVPARAAGPQADVPSGLGGLVLGAPAAGQEDRLRMDLAAPLPYARYVLSVPAVPPPGFSGAEAGLADCRDKGRVIRLKYVFANGSREFFDRVLKEYRKRYGEPDQWRGDPFHLVLAWKWAFVTVRGERLSLMLTHSDDDDSGRGSSVKLTNWTLWERERQCYERSHPPLGTDRPGPQGPAEPSEDLSRFLPQ